MIWSQHMNAFFQLCPCMLRINNIVFTLPLPQEVLVFWEVTAKEIVPCSKWDNSTWSICRIKLYKRKGSILLAWRGGSGGYAWVFLRVDFYFIFILFHIRWLCEVFKEILMLNLSPNIGGEKDTRWISININGNFTALIINHRLTYFSIFFLSVLYSH